ncbi:TcpE family conjugal transfer membrane protein [Paenibacillus melissococcoides]
MRTYNAVWKIPKMLYGIVDISFPFPVSFQQIGISFLTLFVVIVLNNFPPLSLMDAFFTKFFLIPIASAWFFTKYRLDGKMPHRFIISWIRFKLSPHQYNRYKSLSISKKPYRYSSIVYYRVDRREEQI